MKKTILFLALVAVVASVGASFSFTSEDVYRRGKEDNEYTWATAGRDIDAGQWVVMSYSDALTDDGLDTCSIVTLTSTENTNSVVGVAMMDADTEALIKILVHGYTTIAKVDGVDSGANTATTLARGAPLAITAKLGYAGHYATTVGAAAVPAGTQICGYLIEAVTARANAAAFADTSTAYDVFVDCR